MKIALMIPTKDRPDDLRKLLKSISSQTRKPDQIVLVDGSGDPVQFVVNEFDALDIDYVQVRPPSLPKQRNVGINSLREDVNWAGFLDDDLVLEPGAIENIENFVNEAGDPKLRGVGMKILNQPTAKVSLFNRIFLLTGREGQVTRSGFASEIPAVTEDISVDWVYGGATFWHAEVFNEFQFDEWFKGTGYLEDVDFSYGVSRKYNLRVCEKSQCNHYSHPIRRSKQKAIGEWQITAWWYFVSKYKDFSSVLVFWSMIGVIIRNVVGAVLLSRDKLLRLSGNLKGLVRILNGTAKEARGFSK